MCERWEVVGGGGSLSVSVRREKREMDCNHSYIPPTSRAEVKATDVTVFKTLSFKLHMNGTVTFLPVVPIIE
jgi:hypothetical protein